MAPLMIFLDLQVPLESSHALHSTFGAFRVRTEAGHVNLQGFLCRMNRKLEVFLLDTDASNFKIPGRMTSASV